MRLRGTGGDRPLHRENHPVRGGGRRRPAGPNGLEVVGAGRAVAGLIAPLRVSADFSLCSAVKRSW